VPAVAARRARGRRARFTGLRDLRGGMPTRRLARRTEPPIAAASIPNQEPNVIRNVISTLLVVAALAAPAARADDDLGGVSLEPSLRLYGFADFSYSKVFLEDESSWDGLLSRHGAFSIGNLNLYLDAQLSERARSLVEIRFTYLPNGGLVTLGPGLTVVTNGGTLAADHTRFGLSTMNWGAIVIERAFAEYAFSDLLTLRAGQFLTPYGIWNVDHGSPAIVGIARPYIINAYVFPERQMGLEAYGARYFGSTRVGWHLTLSNGRNENDPQDASRTSMPQWTDHDGKFGYGARVFAETEALGDLRVGLSGYTGRFTARTTGFEVLTGTPVETISRQYDEWAAGADLRWSWRHLLLQTEALWQSREDTGADPTSPGNENGRSGVYLLAGWRLPWNVMPFVMGQFYNASHADSRVEIWGGDAGVNVMVQPNLVLKAAYSYYEAPRAPDTHFLADPVSAFMTQAAWAF
jgi:hypothetical protein